MKVVVQRVCEASVTVAGGLVSQIGAGMMVLHGVEVGDTTEDMDYIERKLLKLRIFDDDNGVMNRDIVEVKGDILLVSQFTLLASTKKAIDPVIYRLRPPHFRSLCMTRWQSGSARLWESP